jgi:hypothetical protein
MVELPQPTPQPAPVPAPRDVRYGGTLRLAVDVTDIDRRIYQARVTIPVERPGPMMLLYPKWLPGFHAPQAPIELFAGLVITANGRELDWKRHPVTVNAFAVDVPEGAGEIEAAFQFLTPTDPSQGRVIVTAADVRPHRGVPVLRSGRRQPECRHLPGDSSKTTSMTTMPLCCGARHTGGIRPCRARPRMQNDRDLASASWSDAGCGPANHQNRQIGSHPYVAVIGCTRTRRRKRPLPEARARAQRAQGAGLSERRLAATAR